MLGGINIEQNLAPAPKNLQSFDGEEDDGSDIIQMSHLFSSWKKWHKWIETNYPQGLANRDTEKRLPKPDAFFRSDFVFPLYNLFQFNAIAPLQKFLSNVQFISLEWFPRKSSLAENYIDESTNQTTPKNKQKPLDIHGT